MIELLLHAFHHGRVNFVLGPNEIENCLKGFRLGFETERFVKCGKAQFRFDRNIQVDARGAWFLVSRHFTLLYFARPHRSDSESRRRFTQSMPDMRREAAGG